MTPELMTWVAGISCAGLIVVLWRLYIMSHVVNTLWATFKSETETMRIEQDASGAITDVMIGRFMESIERFDERLGIVEKELGKTK